MINLIESITSIDIFIIIYGLFLFVFHWIGWYALYPSKNKLMIMLIRNHEAYQNFLYKATELLPVLALIGTVLGMYSAFGNLDLNSKEGMQDVVRQFGTAMSATLWGLGFSALNLFANACLAAAWHNDKKVLDR